MNILIVDNGSAYLSKLIDLTNDFKTTVMPYSQLPDQGLSVYNLIILSGGHQFPVIGHEDKFAHEIDLIKNSKVPILGICLGFELIGRTYGAKLQQLQAKEKTILAIHPDQSDPLFISLNDLRVFENHRWVISDPGPHLIPLAHSKDGIEIIKHRHKLIYGFQFHPEMFVKNTLGDELFANFIKIVQNKHI